jgi:hypothetical protein
LSSQMRRVTRSSGTHVMFVVWSHISCTVWFSFHIWTLTILPSSS